ncbi:hypothetical protein D5018_19975 [Parashewanella curva]|uniref:Uncharacterized protein n=1 Tax=Parashewanella curva TaxID=2338552 RepID=A0A3L8PRT3_9GAMM|nr:hypothetical protein [Parashewanella curva]RLV57934.1 hypothetical protein D5018_19975 [Parashewanella curva]
MWNIEHLKNWCRFQRDESRNEPDQIIFENLEYKDGQFWCFYQTCDNDRHTKLPMEELIKVVRGYALTKSDYLKFIQFETYHNCYEHYFKHQAEPVRDSYVDYVLNKAIKIKEAS